MARDRFGIKPFYYYTNGESFVFASDIPSILTTLKKYQINPNYQSIYDFLLFNRTHYSENSFFENIKKLKHSHKIILKK